VALTRRYALIGRVGRRSALPGHARGRTQITRFGAAQVAKTADQVAAHSGGNARLSEPGSGGRS